MSSIIETTIGALGHYINGRGFKPDEWGESGLPIVRIANLNNPKAPYDYFSGSLNDGHLIDTGDIIVSWSATLDAFRWDRGQAALNQHSFKVVPNEDLVDVDYLFYILKKAMVGLSSLVHGATMKHVTRPEFEGFKVWISSDKAVQRQIAARLKAQLAEVETARKAVQVQLQEVRTLAKKIVDFGFDQFADWQRIGDVAKLQSGYAFKSESFKTSGVRLLRNTNILPGKIYWDEAVYLDKSEADLYPRYVLETGDVLISLDRPLISSGIKVARVGKDDLPALLLQRVGRFLLTPGTIDADFLYLFLQSTRFIDAISGHDQSLGVPHISPSQVESIEIPRISLDQQRNIVASLDQQLAEANVLQNALEQQLHDLDALPQRILAQAFEN